MDHLSHSNLCQKSIPFFFMDTWAVFWNLFLLRNARPCPAEIPGNQDQSRLRRQPRWSRGPRARRVWPRLTVSDPFRIPFKILRLIEFWTTFEKNWFLFFVKRWRCFWRSPTTAPSFDGENKRARHKWHGGGGETAPPDQRSATRTADKKLWE